MTQASGRCWFFGENASIDGGITAMRFNGSWFDVDLDSAVPAVGDVNGDEEDRRAPEEE